MGPMLARRASRNAALPLPGASYISALSAEPWLCRIPPGHVAEWLRSGLQNRLRRFNSGRGLHSPYSSHGNDIARSRQGAPFAPRMRAG
jgi:hypothetical protein